VYPSLPSTSWKFGTSVHPGSAAISDAKLTEFWHHMDLKYPRNKKKVYIQAVAEPDSNPSKKNSYNNFSFKANIHHWIHETSSILHILAKQHLKI